MKAYPILMSAPMVRALLEGRKTQTRRVIKPQPTVDGGADDSGYGRDWWLEWKSHESGFYPEELARLCPYGKPGDLLWVRETWIHGYEFDANDMPIYDGEELREKTWYRASDPELRWADHDSTPWKPSIHMPRWASRLTLELTEVRVERLWDISYSSMEAEGCLPSNICGGSWTVLRDEYWKPLWESINGPASWDANPWVWVLTFRVHQQNVDDFIKSREAA
jgi:hypothetical protein